MNLAVLLAATVNTSLAADGADGADPRFGMVVSLPALLRVAPRL